jgi:hypothetical protein
MGMTMTRQQAQDQPVRETTTAERVDEQPTPRRTLQIEALEQRLAPTVNPPTPLPGL